jgi:DNA-binding CsgD family transcriptional regulator
MFPIASGGRNASMPLIIAILVFAANMIFRDGTVVGSIFLAIILTVAICLVLGAASHAARQGKSPRSQAASKGRKSRTKPAPITDGDIGPYVTSMLERGDHDAVILCIEEYIPGSWTARQDIIDLVEEHGRLQRSIRIASLAGVPMPDEAAGFSSEQIELIADRARRMAFVHQHGAMNPRIAASLTRLANGTEPLIALSTTLRADLAESTGNPQWGEHEERELLRKLERMSNTLRAMNSDLVTDAIPETDGSLTPREREVLALLIEGKSNPAIADALSISQRTVTTHLSRLYAKLDVSTRTEAIALAMRTGLASSSSERTQA